MVLKLFLIIFLPLFLIFSAIAYNYTSFRIYLLGALVSSIYFFGAVEGIVYIYCNKIPLNQVPALGFLVNVIVRNPYSGPYKLLVTSYLHHKFFFLFVLALFLCGLTLIFLKKKRENSNVDSLLKREVSQTPANNFHTEV